LTELLIIGAGLLGSSLALQARDVMQTSFTFNAHPVEIEGCHAYHLDLGSCPDLIRSLRPDYIVLTAAMTNVDLCETDQDAAWQINVQGPKEVASASRKAGSKLIYISTDYVFDGLQGNYCEQDAPSPLNYYGESKLAGERLVHEACPECLILRTSVLYGWNPTRLNFVTWAVSELQEGRSINVVTDQRNTPTYSSDLAGMILRLKDEQGVFHASGRERINRYDFTIKVAEAFGLDSSLINPISSGELRWTARRPVDSSLNVSKVSGIVRPLNVDEGLKQMKLQKEARL
jgi:dTDP-4-dehydrorhamnose reductase